jgi:Lon protease-like protein
MMPQDKLPLFPLGVVLFPGGELPLHIFEERYKEMIDDCLRDNLEFGVVLASEKGMANLGCTAVVERILKKYPDGRMDILARGRRRFEIILLDEEKTYLQAAVVTFGDEADDKPVPEAARQRALSAYVSLMMLEHGGLVEDMPDANRPDLSFVLAQPLKDLEFRQQLLAMRSEGERLEALAQYLPAYLERQKLLRHARRVAPLNGYARHAADIEEASS